jgi:hypothetical protein
MIQKKRAKRAFRCLFFSLPPCAFFLWMFVGVFYFHFTLATASLALLQSAFLVLFAEALHLRYSWSSSTSPLPCRSRLLRQRCDALHFFSSHHPLEIAVRTRTCWILSFPHASTYTYRQRRARELANISLQSNLSHFFVVARPFLVRTRRTSCSVYQGVHLALYSSFFSN